MIKGTIDEVKIEIRYNEEGCSIETPNENLKRLLEHLSGEVFNPITYETYYTNLVDNELDGYLLISDLVNYNYEVDLSEHPEIETINDQEVVY